MNAKIRRQLAARKRRIEKRLDKTRFPEECPVISAANIHYELADKTRIERVLQDEAARKAERDRRYANRKARQA